MDACWYRRPEDAVESVEDLLASGVRVADDPRYGLWAILKEYEVTPPSCSWFEAVSAFHEALARAASCQAERQCVYDLLGREAHVESERLLAQESLGNVQQQIAEVRSHAEEAERVRSDWQAERERRHRLRVEHQSFRPGLLEWLTTWGSAMREWRQRDGVLAHDVTVADQTLLALRADHSRLSEDVRRLTHVAVAQQEALRRWEQELADVRASLHSARAALGRHFPDETWWKNREHREKSALWTDPAWNDARTSLFLAALRLHKAFLQHAATQMRQSLQGAMDLLSGEAPRDLPEDAALAAWRALFFVVPVVSTTFASFARLFAHLGRETLGWLLVDEAGQATPQSAVGALWRSKRAVVVGDPLQLEPITTLPFRAEQAIRLDHGVDEQWLSCRTSVQRLADRLTPLGTWLPEDDGKIWVGAPLTVHRRCDGPMFGIVNDIAYGGLMINGTNEKNSGRFREKFPSLPPSKWINVVSSGSQGHWIPDEGRHLDRILTVLRDLRFDMAQVMVIAPFRDIARRVRSRAERYPGLVAGTIHTAQGKQADIVILVLGSDPQRHGARRWAASKPNLLNVAVSRAKRRLYVIGDRRAWAQNRYFDVLSARLPDSTPR
ncbi:AAA domain-containing protein [Streptoalloteichus hindustanus]|uniref:AAA domain-containing protein n=1 Tax=Streptoalloteichus hindustanus TaxID=2017 RepID=A0A1M5LF57_STRHI|nr:AAA domain-containing protein [Streptoalloteichus hindustanus]